MQGFENRLHFSRELAAGVVNSCSKAGSGRMAFIGLQGACPSLVCKAHALFRRKPVSPFLKFTLTHRGSAKEMAEHGVGLQPSVACEFKRAGFPEWRCEGNAAFANLKGLRLQLAACGLRLAS